MPINLIEGPNAGISKTNIALPEAGFTADNTKRVTEIGLIPKSHDPKRTINSLNNLSEKKGYYFEMLMGVDLSAHVVTGLSIDSIISPPSGIFSTQFSAQFS